MVLKQGMKFVGKINHHKFKILKIYHEKVFTESGKKRIKKHKMAKVLDITTNKECVIGFEALKHCAISII